MSILQVEDLQAHYITRTYGRINRVRAVDGISLIIEKNEIFGIAGESGCGKTTLLKTLCGLARPPLQVIGGTVDFHFQDRQLSLMGLQKESQRREVRGAYISYIPQGSMSVLNPVRRIKKSFEDFVYAHRSFDSQAQFDDFVVRHLEAVGLDSGILQSYPHQLSGGMRQRVTIALSTILRPELILADEPTTALDVVMQRGVIQLLKKIKEEQENTIVMITHDMAIHANICDRLAIMYAGQIVEIGTTHDIFTDARHPYTQFLIGSLPRIGDKSYRPSAPGSPPSLIDPPPGCRFHPRCPHFTGECQQELPRLFEVKPGHLVACFRGRGYGQ